MLLAALEPGREMAIANFFLAIFCLFTITLPLVLITRGDKSEANLSFLAATINPWSKVTKEAELAQVVISEITQTVELEANLQGLSSQKVGVVSEEDESISLKLKIDDLDDSSIDVPSTDDELLAA